jgi:lipopolysaccharide/colanic/teichoic acid biosynthesis glycosyltransferase
MEKQNVSSQSEADPPKPPILLWKRLLDLALVLVSAPVWLLAGGGIALLVKCGSPGPVFYCQRRVGYRGRQFVCYKFRTMKPNADSETHRQHVQQLIRTGGKMQKLDAQADPRLIPLGARLRAMGLDELPQLLNVLRGEMSLVGPRPCIPYEYELYEPWQRQRLDAIPGLTGLWQVSGKNRTTFNEMVQLDIEYAERSNLWLDLRILFKTLPALWQQSRETRALQRKAANSPAGITKIVP